MTSPHADGTAEPPVPSSAPGRRGLAGWLAHPERTLVACDYDGTLAPIVDDPTKAVPAPGAVEALAALAPQLAAAAVITGRPALTAAELGGLERVPGLIVLGAYGAQRWVGGELLEAPEPLPGGAVEAVKQLLLSVGIPGLMVEEKGSAVAVHSRQSADPDSAIAVVVPELTAIAKTYDLTVEPGRYVVELRTAGSDKGTALRGLVADHAVETVVFVGDDLGDLAAFAAVDALRASGQCTGLTVAAESAEAAAVGEAADLVVEGPAGVVSLLTWVLASLDR